MAKEKEASRQLDADEIKNIINKKAGHQTSFDLTKEDPTLVEEWIPTGSRLLDSIICEGVVGGIPAGSLVEIAGMPNSGKSFLAISICSNAIDLGYTVVYFDAEGGVESNFLHKVLGIEKMKKFIYNQVSFLEEIFETIDNLLATTTQKFLFVLDSYAGCASKAETEGTFDPTSMFAINSRIASLGCKKLMMPLRKRGSTLIILNQVRDNIGANKYELAVTPFRVPGGLALAHAYSLRIWLFAFESKAKSLMDENSNKIGKIGRALIKKSRYRTEGRECPMQFVWSGENPRLVNEELWGEALKDRGIIYCKGPNTYINFKTGEEKIKKLDDWMLQLAEPGFKQRVEALLDESLVYNYTSPQHPVLNKANLLNMVKDE